MILTVCHCGHDRDTHYESAHTCLGMLCDCKAYHDRERPLPKPVRVAAPPPDDAEAPPTPRIGGNHHPAGCQCLTCKWIFP